MKFAYLTIFLSSGIAFADSKTEVISQLHTYNAFIRHNYRMFGGEQIKLSLFSQKQGPSFLQKEEFSHNVGVPIDLNLRVVNTGISVALGQNSDPNVPKRFMFNWYLSKKLSKKIGANVNFYTDRQERDKTFTYSNINAGLHYQLNPKLGVNFRTEAGKSFNATRFTMNHVLATTWSF